MPLLHLPRRLACALAMTAMMACTSACGTLGTSVASANNPASGVPYYLPKTLFTVGIFSVKDNLNVSLTETYVGDADSGLLIMNYTQGLFSNDTVTITPNDQGLLTSVTTQFDSRAAEAFSKLGEFAGSRESDTDLPILELQIDPGSTPSLQAASSAASTTLRDWARRQRARLPENDKGRAFLAEVAASSLRFEWKWDAVAHPTTGATPCRGSVCVRAKRPGHLTVWRCTADLPTAGSQPAQPNCAAGGVLAATYRASIPNASPAVPINLNGGVFADRTHTLTLQNGMVQTYKVTSNSEIEGLGTSVVGFATAQVRAVASGLQSETDLIKAQVEQTQQRIALAEEQKKLVKAQSTEETDSDEETTDGGAGEDRGTSGSGGDQPEPGETTGGAESAPVNGTELETPATPGDNNNPKPNEPDSPTPDAGGANDEPEQTRVIQSDNRPAGGSAWSANLFGPDAVQ